MTYPRWATPLPLLALTLLLLFACSDDPNEFNTTRTGGTVILEMDDTTTSVNTTTPVADTKTQLTAAYCQGWIDGYIASALTVASLVQELTGVDIGTPPPDWPANTYTACLENNNPPAPPTTTTTP